MHIRARRNPLAVLGAAAWLLFRPASLPAEDAIDFNREVRPILASRCLKCHGGVKRESGLSLLYPETALAPASSGETAIVPGKPDESELIRRVSTDDPDDWMPPKGARLSAGEIEVLRRWIAAGAPFGKHWAYIPPVDHPEPDVRHETWPRGGLDRFVLARLEREGLRPSPEADRATLIRRVSLDLTGLPPTPEEVLAFERDPSTGAYEAVVDRLLDSDAFGERWARVWLDLARYADTQGYEKDNRRTIWRYRDWVIDAFNRDLPYDRFTIEQIAGDLLPGSTTDQLVATAFHRNTMTNTEGGTDDEEFRTLAVIDRVNTTWQVWMGTTFGCVQCHNHPYDPFRHEEYYRFLAFLNNTEDSDRPDEEPTIPTPTAAELKTRQALDEDIAAARKRLDAASPEQDPAPLRKEIESLEKKRKALVVTRTPVLRELPEGKRRQTHVFIRGSFLNRGERVEEGVPQALHPFPEGAPRNRLGLARWIVDPANPLTARVAVNRFWEKLFGRGLVETSEDFGTQGMPPSHPELLDWLALRFMHEQRWSVKRLLREIVLSATYRQSSRNSAELEARDPGNRLLSRGPRFRLEAEMLRDQVLAVSGLLSRKMLGPSVMPPQPEGVWQVVYSGDRWVTSKGEDRYRRGLYTFWRRTSPYPSMIAFDAGSRETCLIRRIRTNTPLQALVMLNDPVAVEAAQALARRMISGGGETAESRVAHGFRLCLARAPEAAEVERLASLFRGELDYYSGNEKAALRMATEPLGMPRAAGGAGEGDVAIAELAAWTVVGNVLMNLDEFLTRG